MLSYEVAIQPAVSAPGLRSQWRRMALPLPGVELGLQFDEQRLVADAVVVWQVGFQARHDQAGLNGIL